MGPYVISRLILFAAPLMAGAPKPPLASWEGLVAAGGGELGKLVQLDLQACSRPTTWEPFLTRFVPEEYICLSAWSDAQLPWLEEDYETPLAVVFARRGSPAARVLAAAKPHERLTLACIPRSFQAGNLWVEVVLAHKSHWQLTEGAVLHVEKALELLGREAPELAREQLERALAAPLPSHAAAAIAGLLERCGESGSRLASFRRH